MTIELPSTFHFEPDPNVSSSTRADTAPELTTADKQVGWMEFNQWTYRIFRTLAGIMAPKADYTNVSINKEPDAGRGATIVTPHNRDGEGALFLIHGGGHIVGSNKEVVALAAAWADQCSIPVICPSYRLAPQHPFPSDLNDLHDAWQWLMTKAEALNINPEKIVIGGQSAGGGLAAALVQRLLDEGGIQPAAQLLIYPMLDDRTAAKRELDKPRHRVWSNRSNLFGWMSYLGPNFKNAALPYAVPARRDDLSGLPPAWITVGTPDLFLDEDREYASRLKNTGVNVTYLEIDGAIHGFEIANTDIGRTAIRLHGEFIRKHTS